MAYVNLPGMYESRLDGNLLVNEAGSEPVVCILGTSSKGDSETAYRVKRVGEAVSVFGTSGNLIRGMYEVLGAGSKNLKLFRIGSTAATLSSVGTGLTIETILKDDSAGTDYKLFYEDSSGRLRIWRANDNELVYDNSPSYPLQAIDLNEVCVSGTATPGAGSIPTSGTPGPSAAITLAAADGVSGAVYAAGTDGLDLSRMEMWESLYKAYRLLENEAIDVIVPVNIYEDDKNVMDLNAAGVAAAGLAAVAAYPDAGSSTDYLGKVYTEEYNGSYYFWWWFPTQPNADVDTQFAADGGANIFSSVSGATATTKTDGNSLTGTDFHEVNFAYELANFCYEHSSNIIDCTGVIGMLPPQSYCLGAVSQWVGKLPTTTEDSGGNIIVDKNGSGLLGNKFMAGRKADPTDAGYPGLTINGINGLYGGGFYATDTGFLDGAQQEDTNGRLIDIGAYISVAATYGIIANPSRSRSYVATVAPSYAGFYNSLAANSSPANKLMPAIRLPYRIGNTKLDLLAGLGYVTMHQKPKGIVVSDAPTAARWTSDYRRLTTIRIVKAVVDALRSTAEPFLGEPLSDIRLAALDTRIGEECSQKVRQQYLQRYDKALTSTPTQRVLGQAILELVLVPAFELRQLSIVVALSAI